MILTTSFQKVLESSTKVTQNCTGYLRLYLKYGNRNVATNTDTIFYEIRQYAYNPYGNYLGWEYSPSLSWSIKADNVTKASGSYKQSAIYSNGKEVVRASGSWTQPHNADGNWSANLTLSGYVYTTKLTKSGAVSLPLIPRKSSIAVTNGNIGSNTTIAIFSASSTFTHTLKFSVGSIVNSVIVEKTNQTSYLWKIPTSIYAQTPNSNSVIVTVSCETFSGATSLGTTTTTFSAYVTNSNPIYNKIVYDENTIAQELTGSNDIFIKDYSIAQINGTLTPVNSATLVGGYATQKITNGNQTLSNFSGFFDPVTSKTISFVMKDSRGNEPVYDSEYPTYTIANWVEYIKPSIRSIVVERTEQTSTEVTASLNGEYFHGSFGAVNNSIKYAWRYKLSGSSEWGSWSEYVPLETTSNYWYIDIVLGNEYDTKLSYDFQFKLVDEIGARDSTMEVLSPVQNVTVSTPIIEVYEDRFNVNGDITSNDVAVMLKQVEIIESGTNADDYKENGRYFFSFTNRPTNLPVQYGGYLEVLQAANAYTMQKFYIYETNDIYIRYYNNNVWEDWKKISIGITSTPVFLKAITVTTTTTETNLGTVDITTNGIYLLLANIGINNYGESGRELHIIIRKNSMTGEVLIDDTNVFYTGTYAVHKTVFASGQFSVGDRLYVNVRSSGAKNWAVGSNYSQIIKL